jgi:hypothetical protein
MTRVMEDRVSGWVELEQRLFEGAWHDDLRRFRATHAFRGAGRGADALVTGLGRLGRHAPDLERHILRAFRKYAHHVEMQSAPEWHWLMLGEHHGLPTRLLDWSYSPYVALHFATERQEDYEQDGVIWKIDYARTNQYLPESWRQRLAEAGGHVFTTELLGREAPDLDTLGSLGDPVLIFLEPPSLDERITNQFALFSLLSRADACLEHWLSTRVEVCRRIVIPAALKWEIRDRLDQANITERVLYPGLDGLTRWLTRYYTPRTELTSGRDIGIPR